MVMSAVAGSTQAVGASAVSSLRARKHYSAAAVPRVAPGARVVAARRSGMSACPTPRLRRASSLREDPNPDPSPASTTRASSLGSDKALIVDARRPRPADRVFLRRGPADPLPPHIRSPSSVVRAMGSTFGRMFRVTTFGESHGGGVGCVVDGVPPRLQISRDELQFELDRRRPGQSRITTPGTRRTRARSSPASASTVSPWAPPSPSSSATRTTEARITARLLSRIAPRTLMPPTT